MCRQNSPVVSRPTRVTCTLAPAFTSSGTVGRLSDFSEPQLTVLISCCSRVS